MTPHAVIPTADGCATPPSRQSGRRRTSSTTRPRGLTRIVMRRSANVRRLSSKEKGGSGAHDHSRHKIATHSKFPRHKFTPQIQKFYLSTLYLSPSTKYVTRHNFQLIHSNPHKLHQDEFHTAKVDYSRDQGSPQLYKKNPNTVKIPHCHQRSVFLFPICH